MKPKYSLSELLAQAGRTEEEVCEKGISIGETLFFDFFTSVFREAISRSSLKGVVELVIPEAFITFQIKSIRPLTKLDEQDLEFLLSLVDEALQSYFGFVDSRLQIKMMLVDKKVRGRGFYGNGFISLKSSRYKEPHASTIILHKLPTEKDIKKFIWSLAAFHENKIKEIRDKMQKMKDQIGLETVIAKRVGINDGD